MKDHDSGCSRWLVPLAGLAFAGLVGFATWAGFFASQQLPKAASRTYCFELFEQANADALRWFGIAYAAIVVAGSLNFVAAMVVECRQAKATVLLLSFLSAAIAAVAHPRATSTNLIAAEASRAYFDNRGERCAELHSLWVASRSTDIPNRLDPSAFGLRDRSVDASYRARTAEAVLDSSRAAHVQQFRAPQPRGLPILQKVASPESAKTSGQRE